MSCVVQLWYPALARRLPRHVPQEVALSLRYVGFLTQVVYLLLLVPLWELVIYHHDHTLFWCHVSWAHFPCSVGMSADRVTGVYLTLLATGFCALGAGDLLQFDDTDTARVKRLTVRRGASHLCFALALLSTNIFLTIICWLIGFSVWEGLRSRKCWLSHAKMILMTSIAACAVWIAAMGGSAEPWTIRNNLPAISVATLTASFWTTSLLLALHAMLAFFFSQTAVRERRVLSRLAGIAVWLVLDCFLFYRLVLSVMPPWILAAAGL